VKCPVHFNPFDDKLSSYFYVLYEPANEEDMGPKYKTEWGIYPVHRTRGDDSITSACLFEVSNDSSNYYVTYELNVPKTSYELSTDIN